MSGEKLTQAEIDERTAVLRRFKKLLEEKRNTLLRELDTQIKVSNATTFIEV